MSDTTPGDDRTRVSDATREAERRESLKPADAGGEPTADEAEAAERIVDPEVAKAAQEPTALGANVQREGRIA